MTKAKKKRSYKSPLERHPKYVRAIGMISIENGSLEILLGELLGSLLGIHYDFSQLLFYTPNSSSVRLSLIESIIEPSIGRDKKLTAEVQSILKRARRAIGKRNTIIHAVWTDADFIEDGEKYPLPVMSSDESIPGLDNDAPLKGLETLVGDYRLLIEETILIVDKVRSVRGLGYRRPWFQS